MKEAQIVQFTPHVLCAKTIDQVSMLSRNKVHSSPSHKDAGLTPLGVVSSNLLLKKCLCLWYKSSDGIVIHEPYGHQLLLGCYWKG